jgi:Na+/melibiose symporter-like transporter
MPTLTEAPRFDPATHARTVAANYRPAHIAWIALLYCITGLAEATSNFILPDTIHRFTGNAFVISMILAMNPFFGFVAQPWAGWYSDRIWTPLGRRRPVIIVATVCLALSCLGLPLVQAQAAHLPWLGAWLRGFGEDVSLGLALVAFWNLIYQAMVDVVSIMVRCIIGDVIPARHRGKAFAAANVVSVCMIFATLRWGGTIMKANELHWYLVVASVALLALLPATFLLTEPYVPPAPKAARGNLRSYWRTVRDTPHFFPMCLVIACTFVAAQLVTNYYRLFTREQLHLGIDEALKPFSWMPIISFVASYPVGWFADRVSSKYATMAGACALGLAGAWGVWATSIWDLRIMALLTGCGFVCMEVGANPYLISFMPPDKIGQLSGFANVFRGGPRFLMFFRAGALIEIFGRNYRIAFGGSVVFAIVALVLLAGMPRQVRPSSS